MKTFIRFISALGLLLALCGIVTPTFADSIPSPQYDTFGSQSSITFGGSGIPNDSVAFSTFLPGAYPTSQIGLSFTQRYNNPALTNDGAGTFTGLPGSDAANGQAGYATWNVDLYVANIAAVLGQSAVFTWGWTPDVGSALGGSFSLGAPLVYQDSWNFGMNFLGGLTGFDPSIAGQGYATVSIIDANGVTLKAVTGNINTGGGSHSVSDGGSTALLTTLALTGLVLMRRKIPALHLFPSAAAA